MEQVRIDLVPGGVTPNAHASQYDIGRVIRFHLYYNGSAYTLAGTETVTIKVSKPDDSTETVSVTNTSSNYVDFVTEDDLLDQAGLYPCEIKVTSGSDVIGSQNFNLRVEADAFGNGAIVVLDAQGNPAEFNTDLAGFVVDLKLELPYNPNGYTSASVINSKTTPVIDETPYHTRIAPSNIGNMALEKLVGVSCVFNQLVSSPTTVISFTAETEATELVQSNIDFISGHKYLISCRQKDTISSYTRNMLRITIDGTDNYHENGLTSGMYYWLFPCELSGNGWLGIWVHTPNANVSFDDFNLIDLTAMFGSEVADYLYTLESGTAGAGVALFKSLFGADYYPYTANTLMSAKPTGKKIYNKNLFNGTYDTIFQLPFVLKNGTTLTASCKDHDGYVSYIQYFDKNGTLIDYWALTQKTEGNERQYRTFTIQDDVYSVKFTNNSCEDMQLEYGSTATAYEPYSETTIVYSGNELRGMLKVGTDGLYADGDTDDGSGTETVRYGIVDLSTLSWSQTALTPDITDAYVTGGLQGLAKYPANNSTPILAICSDYMIMSVNSIYSNNKSIAMNNGGNLYVRNDGAGVSPTGYLIYELATPTTQTVSAWTNPIVAKEGGTETFVDTRTIALPTGHDTIYGTDLSVNKAEFGTTVYGGSVDFTTGEVISNKNADGTDKTPADVISVDPSYMPVFVGSNYVMGNTGGDAYVKYYKKA